MVVVLVMVRHLRGSMLVSSLLPFSVLFSFVCMRRFGVDANIVALSGIAIAIGTMVDLGIVLSENILQRFDDPDSTDSVRDRIHLAAAEVAPSRPRAGQSSSPWLVADPAGNPRGDRSRGHLSVVQ